MGEWVKQDVAFAKKRYTYSLKEDLRKYLGRSPGDPAVLDGGVATHTDLGEAGAEEEAHRRGCNQIILIAFRADGPGRLQPKLE